MSQDKATKAKTLMKERIMADVRRLRPLPANVTRLLRTLDDGEAPAHSISDLISLDQVMSAQLLQMANSALLGYGPSCSSISEAVMRLGFKRVKTLVFGIAASGPLARRLSGYQIAATELWSHSVAAATAAQAVARSVYHPDSEEAYVAGLLHDIGKVVLDQYVKVDYDKVSELMRDRKAPMWQIEEELFGFDHAAVGGMVAEKWQFPVALVDAIYFHHAPSLARTDQNLAAITNVANSMTPKFAIGLDDEEGRIAHPEALKLLNLDENKVEEIRSFLLDSAKKSDVA